MRSLILYVSNTGNTAKVAYRIYDYLISEAHDVDMISFKEDISIDLFEYDTVFIGFPIYRWLPPKPFCKFIDRMFEEYSKKGFVKVGGSEIKGKKGVVFCTYSGPHTGEREAIPALKYVGQFFDHIGIEVVKEIAVIGDMKENLEVSTKGIFGYIVGRPDERDLENVIKELNGCIWVLEKDYKYKGWRYYECWD